MDLDLLTLKRCSPVAIWDRSRSISATFTQIRKYKIAHSESVPDVYVKYTIGTTSFKLCGVFYFVKLTNLDLLRILELSPATPALLKKRRKRFYEDILHRIYCEIFVINSRKQRIKMTREYPLESAMFMLFSCCRKIHFTIVWSILVF